ncbi:MAG TPA: hypothetical protein VF092_02860 [Longimicrobium sp.]
MRLTRIAVPFIALTAACGGDRAEPAGDAKTADAPPAAPAPAAAPASPAQPGDSMAAAQTPASAPAAPPAPVAATDTGAKTAATPRTANAPGPIVLPSGRRVNVQAVAPIRFTQGPPALIVRYGTTISMTDTVPLKAEATEVFERFRATAERARLNGLVASAVQEPSRGPLADTAGYNFVWTRGPDGRWHRP